MHRNDDRRAGDVSPLVLQHGKEAVARDRRVFLLGLAGAVIAGLCVFKATRTYSPPVHSISQLRELAPQFELYDQSSPSQVVRLSSYLGRRQIAVIFFDGSAGAHSSPALKSFRDEWSRLRRAGTIVIAVSTALPQENRKDAALHGGFPFPLLSDPDFHIHQQWGRFDEVHRTPLAGVFVIDRKGSVAWSRQTNTPQPAESWQSALAELQGHAG